MANPGERVTFRVGGTHRVGKPAVRRIKAVTPDGTVLVRYGGIDLFPLKPHEIAKIEAWRPRRHG